MLLSSFTVFPAISALVFLIWASTKPVAEGRQLDLSTRIIGPTVLLVILSEVVAFAFLFLAEITMTIPMRNSVQQYEKNRVEIVALSVSTATEGSFFLGTGTIGSAPVYHYRQKNPDGGTIPRQIGADAVVLYEENRHDAYMADVVKRIDTYFAEDAGPIFGFFVPGIKRGDHYKTDEIWGDRIIRIPKGSVTNAFRAGLPA